MKLAVACALLLVPRSATGQDSVRLRFAPVFDAVSHRLFQVHTRVSFPAIGGGSDRVETRETVDLGAARQVAVAGPSGEPVVHLAFDSLRSRSRDGGGAWHEFAWERPDTLWTQVWLDSLLRPVRTRAHGSYATSVLLTDLFTGLPGLILPSATLRVGDAWTQDHDVPLAGLMARAAEEPLVGALRSRTTLQVDSLVRRAGDTLVYLGFNGIFRPAYASAGAALGYGGGVAGTLIWSTGWDGFVAGAARIRVNVRLRRSGGAAPEEVDVSLETTIRHQVGPGP